MADFAEVFKEILDYCMEENNYSYFDMKAYAVKNKPEWIESLRVRKNAELVSYALKDAKRTKGIKYKTPFSVSYENYLEVEIEANECKAFEN